MNQGRRYRHRAVLPQGLKPAEDHGILARAGDAPALCPIGPAGEVIAHVIGMRDRTSADSSSRPRREAVKTGGHPRRPPTGPHPCRATGRRGWPASGGAAPMVSTPLLLCRRPPRVARPAGRLPVQPPGDAGTAILDLAATGRHGPFRGPPAGSSRLEPSRADIAHLVDEAQAYRPRSRRGSRPSPIARVQRRHRASPSMRPLADAGWCPKGDSRAAGHEPPVTPDAVPADLVVEDVIGDQAPRRSPRP